MSQYNGSNYGSDYNSDYNSNQDDGNIYNDDLYMGNTVFEEVPDRKSSGGSGRKGRGIGKRLLSLLLVVCLMAGVSITSIVGYESWTGRHGKKVETVDGGTRAVYTLAKTEGALTPQEIFVKCSPWVVAITSRIRSFYGYSTGTGTGIIMREDGYILTNHHVIEDAEEVTVRTPDGEEYEAMIVSSEAKTDIAVLKIAAEGLEAAEFGTSSELLTGDDAVVIGNPLGLTFADTMTIGYISSTEREVTIGDYKMSLIQIDAAVNPGNSGGPLINAMGQVVGVVNSKIADTDVEGIGFAIPIDKALEVANDLIEYGYVTNRPMLGITVQSISEEQAYFYGYEAGVTVTEVEPGSPADQGGIKVGDRILAFDGVEIATTDDLNFEKEKHSLGDTVTITVERDGDTLELQVTLSAGTAA